MNKSINKKEDKNSKETFNGIKHGDLVFCQVLTTPFVHFILLNLIEAFQTQ